MSKTDVEGEAAASLRGERTLDPQPRESSRFGFLGERCRRKETSSGGKTARPRPSSDEGGDPGTEERAKLAVSVETRA